MNDRTIDMTLCFLFTGYFGITPDIDRCLGQFGSQELRPGDYRLAVTKKPMVAIDLSFTLARFMQINRVIGSIGLTGSEIPMPLTSDCYPFTNLPSNLGRLG